MSIFVGRKKTRPLRPRQAKLLKTLLPELLLDLRCDPPHPFQKLFPDTNQIHLEIGFGAGEYLIARAHTNPDTGFIGVEPFINGMAKVLVGIEDRKLHNIRLYNDDAGHLLDWLPDNSLSQIALLYPDPWPKFRHWKRRFVSPCNLSKMARVIKPGGLFLFASDIEHYVAWTLKHCYEHPAYEWQVNTRQDWTTTATRPWPNWQSTRYETKALHEGRTPTYLTFSIL